VSRPPISIESVSFYFKKATNLAARLKEEYEVSLEKSKSRYESLLRQLKKTEAELAEKEKMDSEDAGKPPVNPTGESRGERKQMMMQSYACSLLGRPPLGKLSGG